ncbi:MerR family transcriptional regulator [Georgenia sp. MJ206]|uniref:MerR family transcriptional regulator n=1 Tax=Georgenia wangjunii TaxID=3117730 RepID=UPI002F266B58
MRSSELARLAGVTVRALRHYHQVGVLAEPERDANGYRRYDVYDLVRVLRIRRLAALGLPLERMPELLDDSAADAAALLEDLDRELADEVDRLTRQREVVARLREVRASPDLPPELAPPLAAFVAAGLSPEMARLDRDQSVLLAHLVGEEGMPYLAGLYARLSTPEFVTAATALLDRFGRLGPDSPGTEDSALVDGFVAALAPFIGGLADDEEAVDLSGFAGIIGEYVAGVLNERQRAVLERIETLLLAPPTP